MTDTSTQAEDDALDARDITRAGVTERAILTPSDEVIDDAASEIMRRRGFGYATDPMEGGQDLYDLSSEAREDARTAIETFMSSPMARAAFSMLLSVQKDRIAARRTALEDAAKAGRKAVNDCRESEETDLRAVRECVSDAIRALIDGEKE